MRNILIKTEFIKLDQLLKHASVVDSGGLAKMMIQDGMVRLNGETETQRGKKIRPGDLVEVLFFDEDGGIEEIVSLKVVEA
jgi:ribosome-associated protein